jgi:hypothetical protein
MHRHRRDPKASEECNLKEDILFSMVNSDRAGFAGKQYEPRILCHFNHYFGAASEFVGKSTTGARKDDAEVVQLAPDGIRAPRFDLDVHVCGFGECSSH